jgi:Spy/CpxP family protein refolding chaperone
MNRSKGAAMLMLVGAFAVGAGTPIVYGAYMKHRPKPPECPQPRTENNFRQRFNELLKLDSTQIKALDELLDERNRAVSEIFAVPRKKSDSIFAAAKSASDSILAPARLKADSVRKDIQNKQNAIYTPEQRAIVEERQAAMRQRNAERQAQRQAEQARCEKLQPKQQSAAPGGRQTQSKSKLNH